MIISNSRKFIYLRVPRTGSTSLSNFLIENVVFDRESDFHTPLPYNRIVGLNLTDATQVHGTLTDIVRRGLLFHSLDEYAVYGVVRDPVERFISAAWHACHYDGVAARHNDEAVAYALRVAISEATVFRPQSDWLVYNGHLINRIFPYERIDALAQAILGVGDTRISFQHRAESRRMRNSELDVALRRTILSRYAVDQEIYTAIVVRDRNAAGGAHG